MNCNVSCEKSRVAGVKKLNKHTSSDFSVSSAVGMARSSIATAGVATISAAVPKNALRSTVRDSLNEKAFTDAIKAATSRTERIDRIREGGLFYQDSK